MGNTIDGIGSASTNANYQLEKANEAPPPKEKEKAEGRSFLDVAASAYEAFTACSGAGNGVLATFINEKQKGETVLDALGYAGAKTVAEMSAHFVAESAGGPAAAAAVQFTSCVDGVTEVATGKSLSEAAVEGPMASNVLDVNAVTGAATAALAAKKTP